MIKHTLGPWEFIEDDGRQVDDCLGPYTICDEARNDLASVYSRENATVAISRSCAIANARLIAAAPDLLDALQDALFCMESSVKIKNQDWDGSATLESSIGKARAAIAKAN